MNFKVAIYHQILEPMYMRVYKHCEELDKAKRVNSMARKAHQQDIVEYLAQIVTIKEKYGIDFSEDLELIEKYKK